MPNPGNSGNRYKLSTFSASEQVDAQHIKVTLSCGHSFVVKDDDISFYKRQEAKRQKTRCRDCPTNM